MTISSISNKVVAQGNGVTNTFSFNFLIPLASDLVVIYQDASGNTTTLAPSQYGVTGIGNSAGGAVTYPLSGSPIATGTSLTIARVLPYQQLTSLVNQSGYYPDVVEAAMDNLEMQIQQLNENIGRAITSPITDPVPLNSLPTIPQRANNLMGFDANGNIVAVAPAAQSATALQALLAAPTGVNLVGNATSLITLLTSVGASLIGWIQSGIGAVKRLVQDKLRETVSIKDYGATGDGVTDDTAAITAFRNYLATRAAAGNTMRGVIPAGRYLCSVSPNWAITGLLLEAQGEVWLINTGTGISFLCDGGATGAGVYDMKITGNLNVYPNINSNHGVFIRAVHRSNIEIESRGAGSAYAAIYIAWCVVTEFRLRATSNNGGWYNAPAYGLYLTQRGTGERTSYCDFMNPIFEGAPINIYCDATLGNNFIGGTAENASNIGMQFTSNALQDKVIGVDMESNTNYDVYCQGTDIEFISCDTLTKLSIAGGDHNIVDKGKHQLVEVLAPASRTLLSGFKYNRTSGTAFPTDNSSNTRYRDLTNAGTGVTHNVPIAVTALTVTASPYTYTNNSANEQAVLMAPGTVSNVAFVRGGLGAFNVQNTVAMHTLSPGDSLTVTYSSAPAMYVFTR